MNKDLKYIKRHYGEDFARFCRSYFPTVLEKEGELTRILRSTFAPTKDLYNDLAEDELLIQFVSFVFSQFGDNKSFICDEQRTPYEILAEKGYTLYKCNSHSDTLKFKKYYAEKEELCTFRDENRTKTHHVFFAIRNDADSIKRKDFKIPRREDDYSLSVLSIQFKNTLGSASIKSRYNHSVENPDAVFGNNLEMLAEGLSQSFIKECGLVLQDDNEKDFCPENYIEDENGIFHRVNYCDGDLYICQNNVVLSNGKTIMHIRDGVYHPFNDGSLDVVEYFVFDYKAKKIETLLQDSDDSFISTMPNIKHIESRPRRNSSLRDIVVTYQPDGEKNLQYAIVTTDEGNKLVGFENKFLTSLPDCFFGDLENISKLDIPNVEEIGHSCLSIAQVENISLPKVKKIGHYFMDGCERLQTFEAPNLEEIGCSFLSSSKVIHISLPKLRTIGDNAFYENEVLETFEAPNLEEVGHRFMYERNRIISLSLPKLKKAGHYFCDCCSWLKYVDFPSLERVGSAFLSNSSIETLALPNLVSAEDRFLAGNTSLREVYLPKLKRVQDFCLKDAPIDYLDFPSLESIGSNFASGNKVAISVDMPNVKFVGNRFLENNSAICDVQMPKLKEVGYSFLENCKLHVVSFPALKSAGDNFMIYNDQVESIDLPNLREARSDFFLSANLPVIELPSLLYAGSCFFRHNKAANFIFLPNIKMVGDYFFENCCAEEIIFPNLTNIGDFFMVNNKSAQTLQLPAVTEIKDGFMQCNNSLKEVNLPNIKTIGDSFMANNKKVVSFVCPRLESVGDGALASDRKLIKIETPSGLQVGGHSLKKSRIKKVRIVLKDKLYKLLGIKQENTQEDEKELQ